VVREKHSYHVCVGMRLCLSLSFSIHMLSWVLLGNRCTNPSYRSFQPKIRASEDSHISSTRTRERPPLSLIRLQDENWVAYSWVGGQFMFGVAPPRPVTRLKPTPKEPEFDWASWTDEPVHIIPISELSSLVAEGDSRGDSKALVDSGKAERNRHYIQTT